MQTGISKNQNAALGHMGSAKSNGLQLPEGVDFGALHFQLSTNFDRSTMLDLTTEPPLLGRCCYMPYYFPMLMFKFGSSTCSLIFAFSAVKTLNNVSIVTLLALFSSREICAF